MFVILFTFATVPFSYGSDHQEPDRVQDYGFSYMSDETLRVIHPDSEAVFLSFLTNTGTSADTYRFVKRAELPTGWGSNFCVGQMCVIGNTLNYPFQPAQTETVSVHVYPSGLPGEGVVTMTIRSLGDTTQEAEITFTTIAQVGAVPETHAGSPGNFRLWPNSPNPFNARTIIAFNVKGKGLVTLRVYSILGREVVTLVDGDVLAGFYRVAWDGRDQQGNPMPSGVYFYQVKAKNFIAVKKMLLVR